MPSELERQLARYRQAIRDRDLAAQRRLLVAYGAAMDRLAPLIELVEQDIQAMEEPTPATVFRLERYRILEWQLRQEMDALAQQTGTAVRGAQAEAIDLGSQAALDLTLASAADPVTIAGSFANVPRDAIIDLVGTLDPDGPTGQLLQSFGDVAAQAVRDALVSGAALGQNPRLVAGAVQRATGMSAARALLVSRTELLRSYRTAKLTRYAANDDILAGWVWTSAKQARTCAACLSLDGQTFPLSQTFFPSHPACRCTARPKLKDKYAAKRTAPETGAEWLARQDAATQDDILGVQGGAAFRAGEVELGDFVRTDTHPVWGESRRDGGIAWARQRAERRARKEAMRKKPDTVPDVVVKQEDRIRTLKHEQAIAIDPTTGSVVFAKDGGSMTVEFNNADVATMRGNILVHNHPSGWQRPRGNPERDGFAFSQEDFLFAAHANLAEIRAVSPRYRFSLSPAHGRWPTEQAIRRTIARIDAELRAEITPRINSGELSIPEANMLHSLERSRRVADGMGLRFTAIDDPHPDY